MKRLLGLLALPLAGCAALPHPTTPSPPPRVSYTVADIPYVDDAAVLAPWNDLAGYPLFVSVRSNAEVTFVPLRLNGEIAGTVHQAGGTKAVIGYDPVFEGILSQDWFWRHELGHVLMKYDFPGDAGCDDPYRGVMSYCEFYGARPGWFGPADAALVERFTK